MGSGRSGSTILGVVLGNLKNCFYGGELHLWAGDRGIPTDRDSAYEFWERVSQAFPDREKYFDLAASFNSQLEYHTALASLFRSSNREIVQQFHEQSVKFFKAIETVSERAVTIDSSHYALRAHWLNKNPGLDVCYIYLYRDPVEVIVSHKRKDVEQKHMNFFKANVYLIWVSVFNNIIYSFLPKANKMKLRYEDFINRPAETLTQIENKFRLESEELDLKNLDPGNLFRANRIRLHQKISLENKLKKTKVNPFEKALIYLLLWLLVFYVLLYF